MRRTLPLAIALCLICAGCKNSSDDTTTTTTSAPVTTTTALTAPVTLSGAVNLVSLKDFSGVGTNVGVEFGIQDFAFNPTFVKVLPNSSVTYKLENLGSTDHTFTIDSLGIDQTVTPSNSVEGQAKLEETFNVAAVASPSPSASPNPNGIFEFYCRFHKDQGMRGAFYFQAGEVVPGASPEPTSSSGSGTGSGTGTGSGSKTTVRRSSSSGSGTAAVSNTRAGDLFVPDVIIEGSTLRPSTTRPTGTTARAVTTTRRPGSTTKPPPAATGAPGKPSGTGAPGSTGVGGDEGDEGGDGEDGETDSTIIGN